MTAGLFLAGPPDGAPAAVRRLTAAGAWVVNPDPVPEPAAAPDWAEWMRLQLRGFWYVDGVVLLPSGGGSRGVSLICQLAHEMAVPVRTVPGWLTQLGQDAYLGRLLDGRP